MKRLVGKRPCWVRWSQTPPRLTEALTSTCLAPPRDIPRGFHSLNFVEQRRHIWDPRPLIINDSDGTGRIHRWGHIRTKNLKGAFQLLPLPRSLITPMNPFVLFLLFCAHPDSVSWGSICLYFSYASVIRLQNKAIIMKDTMWLVSEEEVKLESYENSKIT